LALLPLKPIRADAMAHQLRCSTLKETQMEAAADEGRVVKPFGFIGLSLSLIGIAVLVLLVSTLISIAYVACFVPGQAAVWDRSVDAMDLAFAHSDTEAGGRMLLGIVLIFHIGLAIAVIVAAKWRGGTLWRGLIGWRNFHLSDKWLWAIMLAALLYSAGADAAIGHFLPHPAAPLTVPTDLLSAAMLFALAVIVGPMTEELLFRGWIYTGLRVHWGLWPALLTTSALFACAHYEHTHIYALAVFPIGLALGAIRERTGSVKASILFHAINNFAAFFVSALNGN
jgi:membrane protease YdiL (CAAX protease family)